MCRFTTPAYDRHMCFQNDDRPFGILRALFDYVLMFCWIMCRDSHSSCSNCLRDRSLKQRSHEHKLMNFQTTIVISFICMLYYWPHFALVSHAFFTPAESIIYVDISVLVTTKQLLDFVEARTLKDSGYRKGIPHLQFLHAPRVSYVILSFSFCFVCMSRAFHVACVYYVPSDYKYTFCRFEKQVARTQL